ncbi:MAG: Ig domain-containing protein [Clostridiales bacterium]|jgi:hypothetical protein|nr:Ig domain-containing protein [Clostridiales bacterium]
MKSKRFTGRIIAYLLVFTLLLQHALTVSTGTAYATSEPKISSKSQDILVGSKYNFNIKNKVKRSTYKWKSSDSSVATVDKRGFVTGIAKGKATITCTVSTSKKNYELTAKVTIRKPAESIEINNKIEKIYVGDKYNLNKTILPAASNDKTSWTTSDASIAKPDKNGIFTALKPGQVTITANTIGGEKDSVTIRALDETNSLTLTKESIVDGKINLSDVSYDYITIDSSVGDAEIIFDNVKVTDTLEMETNATYTVRAINSDINRVVSLEEKEKAISSFALDEEEEEKPAVAPTFIAEEGTLVVTVDARGNVSVRQEGKAEIGTVTVNRRADGNIELNLEGFKGNLVVNTISNADIAIVTKNCDIPEATIGGTSTGQKLSMKDDNANGATSNIGKIKVETSAQLNLDVPAKEMEISESTTNASVTIGKPIDRIVNSGSSTRLQVNNNVSNIVSTGDELNVKVEAGSTIKGIEMAGASSRVDVALGSTIDNIISKGSNSAITGRGKVTDVKVEGNNTKIDTKDTNVSVGENVEGTVKDGEVIPAGTGATPTPAPTPVPGPGPGPGPGGDTGSSPTPTPTPIPIPETGEKITIGNPRDVWAGTDVQMTADYDDIIWSVYCNEGYATIDSESGILIPHYGTVRVAATSKLNPEVYGAVDIVIQDRKFVRMEPLDDIVIDTDSRIIGIEELLDSGLLPTEAKLVYETGKGNETETKTFDIYAWVGEFDGSVNGNYFLIGILGYETGYERLDYFYPNVLVKVKVRQSDTRTIVVGNSSLNTIRLTNDEHLVKVWDIYTKYLHMSEVKLYLPDASQISAYVGGHYIDSSNEFNGAVPDSYIIDLSVNVPKGYIYREEYLDSSSVRWTKNSSIVVPITVIVETVQTPLDNNDGDDDVPDTTQPKYTPTQEVVVIESINISGQPTEVIAGDKINFNDYLSVSTNTDKASDSRVIWTVDGNRNPYLINTNSGLFVRDHQGVVKIRATSAIDSTKYSEVSINVLPRDKVLSYIEPSPIEVDTNMGIYDFKTMWSALGDILPKNITAMTEKNGSMELQIYGWYLNRHYDDVMTLYPYIYNLRGLTAIDSPKLSIKINVPQTDERIVVVSGAAITSKILLDEDRYATNMSVLMDLLYPSSSYGHYIDINATLDGGTTIPLSCRIVGIDYYSTDGLFYDGTIGKVMLELRLILPEGYRVLSPYENYDLAVYVEVDVTVEQSPKYEKLWVISKPKLDYIVGESLDLTGMIVKVGDTSEAKYIGPESFSANGLILRFGSESPQISFDETITWEMHQNYIFIYNVYDGSFACIGRLNVTSE